MLEFVKHQFVRVLESRRPVLKSIKETKMFDEVKYQKGV